MLRRIFTFLAGSSALLLVLVLALESVATFHPHTSRLGDWGIVCRERAVSILVIDVAKNPPHSTQTLRLWCCTIVRNGALTTKTTDQNGVTTFWTSGHYSAIVFAGWKLPFILAILPSVLVFTMVRRRRQRRGFEVLPVDSSEKIFNG